MLINVWGYIGMVWETEHFYFNLSWYCQIGETSDLIHDEYNDNSFHIHSLWNGGQIFLNNLDYLSWVSHS